jgi:predicted nucleic acid-binding protein
VASRSQLSVARGDDTLVDTCVLLDALTDDPKWAEWSEGAMSSASDIGSLVVNPIIYAEVAAGFDAIEDLDEALPAEVFRREPLPYHAGFLASRAYLAYRRNRGAKRSPLPDFYIGAHAAVNGYRLLTRDVARYQTYFPTVRLITPEG